MTDSTSLVRSLADIERLEREMSLEQRLPGNSIFDVFENAAKRHGERPAITMVMTGADDEQPRSVNYRELFGLVRQAANVFTALGGERPGVAYMLPILIQTHAVLWGAETVGYAVPINFLLQAEHIKALLEASGARILVTLGPHPQLDIWEKSLELQRQIPGLILVRIAPPGTPESPDIDGVIDFSKAMQQQPSDKLIAGKAQSGDDVAAYFHTGGTTGVPKLAAHTHNGQLAAAYGASVVTGITDDDVVTATLPMFHVAGTILLGLSVFIPGGEAVVLSPAGLRNPEIVTAHWRLCERLGVTIVGGVPTGLGAVVDIPVGDANISRLRAGLTGGASLPVAVREKFERMTGRPLREIYGMTEASGLIAVNPLTADGGDGSVGFRFPYTQVIVRRLNPDGSYGEPCDANEIGVVTIAGPTVSPGYRNRDQGVGSFLDGVLNSGDLGYLDALGRLYIAGRSKDLIIRSGHNIDPLMIENAMQQHPAVVLAAAVGRPDRYAGEQAVCYVQLLPGQQVTDADLRDHAERTIGERPAWPKAIYVVEAIPMTAVGKIFKPALRQDATERTVHSVLQTSGISGATVAAVSGGVKGMTVTVTLSNVNEAQVRALSSELAGYLFETVLCSI